MTSSKETDVLARIIEISQRLRAVHEALLPLTLDDDEYESLNWRLTFIVDALETIGRLVDDMKSEREASIKEN